tara:strand:+ start:468 stop:1262 length:795 start_codon:yes stop_codon:yes gene_type:complete
MLGLGNSITGGAALDAVYNQFALSFDGTNDHVDTNATFQSTFRNSFSVSCWQNTDNYTQTDTLWGASADSNNFIKLFQRGSGRKLCFQFKSAGSNSRQETASAEFDASNGLDGNWVNWVVTATKSEEGGENITVKIYKNGSDVTAGSALTGGCTAEKQSGFTTDQNIYIGAFNSGSATASNLLPGLIDEWALWSVALDADAVAAIYNSGVPFDLTADSGNYDNSGSLVAFYGFNEGSGTDAVDATGGSNGALTNGPTYSTNIPG